MNRLLDVGFKKVGHWYSSDNSIDFELTQNSDSENVLYCFVSEDEVLYVGKTTQKLTKRMYGYKNPGATQSTNIKGHKKIKELLSKGLPVEILALPDNGLLHFGVFHLNLAAGLEDSIISVINPLWNSTGANAKPTP
jgi:hypothetical protein